MFILFKYETILRLLRINELVMFDIGKFISPFHSQKMLTS
jgi:hypothetical protein